MNKSRTGDTSCEAGWQLSHSYSSLPKEMFEVVQPTPVSQPSLVILNSSLANRLGLDAQALTRQDQVAILAGNLLPPNGYPIAQAYAGHQFGGFAMLGDGRAILLGEQLTPDNQRFDIQLKGSGPTPFSRRGDGRASLGPMLREYIISHAMHCLGIPTTLSLAVVLTGEPVYRYGIERGAVLTRVAASHIRVGTFQYAAARRSVALQNSGGHEPPKDGSLNRSPAEIPERDSLKELADYAIQRHYPALLGCHQLYLQFLKAVIRRQVDLVAQWMCVGFIHGVMNTDNVSIAGETIDYGPCAFMNTYSPRCVFSSIDEQGRYAFGNQPGICQWNLARFAETLLPLLSQDAAEAVELATQAIGEFPSLYSDCWLDKMRRKLGLSDSQEEDRSLVDSLLLWMEEQQMDFTSTLRDISLQRFENVAYQDTGFQAWLARWRQRLHSAAASWQQAQELMCCNNPAVIPRNHCVEEALSSAVQNDDLGPMERLLTALSHPFQELPENMQYRDPPTGGDQGYCTFCGT